MNKFKIAKVLYSFLVLLLVASCDKDDNFIDLNDGQEYRLTNEQIKLRSSLELTTTILLDMIANDPSYIDQLNNLFLNVTPNSLQDRIMLKDLFRPVDDLKTASFDEMNMKFALDFNDSFVKNIPNKANSMIGDFSSEYEKF
jgi:hypothetical protein